MAETFGLIVKYAIVEQSCTRHPVLLVDVVPHMIRYKGTEFFPVNIFAYL